ncbi:MAG: OsmC family protein [Ignavibacteriaceae bacterium]|nr:OsmC family protein [Ignavibacteriaceae bacterium]
MIRTGSAQWNGSGKEGNGTLSTQSSVLNNIQYSFNSRFAEGIGTNPEELVAAAHAGCFSMKFSFVLGAAGFIPEVINAAAKLKFENGTVENIHLEVTARVPGIDAAKFQECAADAKENCPISKLLKTNITMEAKLV